MAKETSRFSALKQLREATPTPAEKPKALSARTRAKLMTGPDAPGDSLPPPPAPSPEPVPAAAIETAPRRRGRPAGMKSDDRFRLTSVMLNKELSEAVRIRMNLDGHNLSSIVNELLLDWVIARHKADPVQWYHPNYLEQIEAIRDQLTRK